MAPHDSESVEEDLIESGEDRLGDGAFIELAKLPEWTVITQGELARIFGKHPISIKRAIDRGELPEPVRLMGKSIWTVGFVLKFLEERLRTAKTELDVFKRHRPASGA